MNEPRERMDFDLCFGWRSVGIGHRIWLFDIHTGRTDFGGHFEVALFGLYFRIWYMNLIDMGHEE